MPDLLGQTTQSDDNLVGPYESWMFDAGKIYDLPGLMLGDACSLSCVAEFKSPIPVEQIGPASKVYQDDGGRMRLRLPPIYAPGGFVSKFVPFMLTPVTASDTDNDLNQLGSDTIRQVLERFRGAASDTAGIQGLCRVNFPILSESVDTQYPGGNGTEATRDPELDPSKPIVIVAIIDHGIPFAHGNFRYKDSLFTRVDYCWSQSALADHAGDVPFGREFNRESIDTMVGNGKAGFHGDEDAIYRAAGVLTRPGRPPMPLDRLHSHGAHVLDTLAGNWPIDIEAQVRIIAVDLPSSSTWETSGFGKDMFVLSAMHYIFERARKIAQTYNVAELPLVVNLSYGYSGGPHDGTGLIEDAFDELLTARRVHAPTALVMPSGNMFQDRLHALVTNDHFSDDPDGPNKIASVQWFAPPNDRTSSFLEIWYPVGTSFSDIGVAVYPPNAAIPALDTALSKTGEVTFFSANIEIDRAIVGQFTIDKYRGERWRVMIILAPTEPSGPDPENHHAAPAGNWTLRFVLPKNTAIPDFTPGEKSTPVSGGIQCRIQCDTSYGQGNTGARQGYFIDPRNDLYGQDGALAKVDWTGENAQGVDAKVRRFGSLNGMATFRNALVVAGHMESSHCAAPYSSAGSLRSKPDAYAGTQQGDMLATDKRVDLSAPTERSPWIPGIVAAGTRTGVTVAFQGTSSAAPEAARQLAALFLKDNMATTANNYLSLLCAASDQNVPADGEGADSKIRLGRTLLSRPSAR